MRPSKRSRGFDQMIVDGDDRVVTCARFGIGKQCRGHRPLPAVRAEPVEVVGILADVIDAAEHDVVEATEQHAEHRACVALRIRASGCTRR